jgi:hypothetical protein
VYRMWRVSGITLSGRVLVLTRWTEIVTAKA